MQHNKNTEFVMYPYKMIFVLDIDKFNLEYKLIKNNNGQIYGYRHTFPKSFHNDALLKLIKDYFFPERNLVPISVSAHLRQNDKEPLFHLDTDK